MTVELIKGVPQIISCSKESDQLFIGVGSWLEVFLGHFWHTGGSKEFFLLSLFRLEFRTIYSCWPP